MTVFAITSQTWLVTVLGFVIVLILLCAFVFLMQGLGAIMQWLEKKPSQPAQSVKPAKPAKAEDLSDADMAAIAMALHLNEEDADMAAVAYALHLYYGLHDASLPQLTIQGHATAWNNKVFGINNLSK
ncbi:MAG: OadG family protein [Paludibacteraceae bacterium]|nr:OadG family protein [Paludibacteraceae bacterium]